MQEVLAGWIGVDVGTYGHYVDSLHVYVSERETLLPQLSDAQPSEIDLRLPELESGRVWLELERVLETLMAQSLTVTGFQMALQADVPMDYQQLIQVAAAQVAWKRGWNDAAEMCSRQLRDPALKTASGHWLTDRKRAGTSEHRRP